MKFTQLQPLLYTLLILLRLFDDFAQEDCLFRLLCGGGEARACVSSYLFLKPFKEVTK